MGQRGFGRGLRWRSVYAVDAAAASYIKSTHHSSMVECGDAGLVLS